MTHIGIRTRDHIVRVKTQTVLCTSLEFDKQYITGFFARFLPARRLQRYFATVTLFERKTTFSKNSLQLVRKKEFQKLINGKLTVPFIKCQITNKKKSIEQFSIIFLSFLLYRNKLLFLCVGKIRQIRVLYDQ